MLTESIGGCEFQLLAQRGVYWPDEQTLFVSDTHLGKEATFRRHSLPAPGGTTRGTLAAIARMLETTTARQLVILGDLFHAHSSLSEDVMHAFEEFLGLHSSVRFTLVLGNHDLRVGALPKYWPIEIVDPNVRRGPVAFGHEPTDVSPDCNLLLCGHLHPAVRVGNRTDSVGKLPCFWLSKRRLVLPAIGEFTGTMTIKPLPNDRVWVVAEGQVIELM